MVGLVLIIMFYSLANAILGTLFFNISISSAKVKEANDVEIFDADFFSDEEHTNDYLEEDFGCISRNVDV